MKLLYVTLLAFLSGCILPPSDGGVSEDPGATHAEQLNTPASPSLAPMPTGKTQKLLLPSDLPMLQLVELTAGIDMWEKAVPVTFQVEMRTEAELSAMVGPSEWVRVVDLHDPSMSWCNTGENGGLFGRYQDMWTICIDFSLPAEGYVRTLMAHELGHSFGIGHIAGTMMSSDEVVETPFIQDEVSQEYCKHQACIEQRQR